LFETPNFAVKILVTGGAGFIGSHVAEYYAQKGHEVIAFDNLARSEMLGAKSRAQSDNKEFLKKYKNVNFLKGDIRNFDELKEASSGCEVIIHAAAQVAVTTSMTNPRVDFEVNSLGTFNVMEAARMNDSVVVYSSTNKVYGENVNNIRATEKIDHYEYDDQKFKLGIPEDFSIDLTGHSPYGCSKLSGDLYVQDYAHTWGLRTAVFRQSCIYGERQYGVEDQGWVAWFVISLLNRKEITIYGDGKQVRDVLYVKDLVRAFDLFIESNLRSGVFNMGGGANNTLSLLQLLGKLKELTGIQAKTRFGPWRPSDQKVYISDISNAEKLLNWRPEISVEQGLKYLVDWVSREMISTVA
jgi:CDP-paratose 2-epimerase